MKYDEIDLDTMDYDFFFKDNNVAFNVHLFDFL